MSHSVVKSVPAIVEEGHVLDGTYRLIRYIGEGGMGRVYEAAHARLAGRYAIKLLLEKLSANPEALARFDREARITSSLQHPNIVQVIDFNTTHDGTDYLVMELLRGESLAARLARTGPQPLRVVVDVVEQVAAGLAAAHRHGIVHRDLKPDNIFLVPVDGKTTDWAKILDFGISKARDGGRVPGAPVSALMGTPLYMAPEQCQGHTRDVNAATDQFALAAIAYEMLTGQPPFAGGTVGDVLAHVVHDDPPPMQLGGAVEAVIGRALAKRNADRFPSVTAFASAFRVAAGIRAGAVTHGGSLDGDDDGDADGDGATGEVAGAGSARAKGIARGHSWAVVLAVAAAIVFASAFVVRQARNGLRAAESPPVAAAPVSAASVAVPARLLAGNNTTEPAMRADVLGAAALPDPGDTGPGQVPASAPTARGVRPIVINIDRTPEPPVPQRRAAVRNPAPAPAPLVTRQVDEPQSPAPARAGRPASTLRSSSAFMDGDATLPLDESVGDRP
ncbi:MAG: protein kinase [Verrucomicrobiota bacterium]